jgi:hypothetical protein
VKGKAGCEVEVMETLLGSRLETTSAMAPISHRKESNRKLMCKYKKLTKASLAYARETCKLMLRLNRIMY